MPHNPKEQIRTLEQQLEKIQRELKQARAAERQETEKQIKRRKLIGGGIVETYVLKNPQSDFAKTYVGLLKESVTPIDRWLFDGTFRALLPNDEADTLLAKSK
jgi:hypothetical protein